MIHDAWARLTPYEIGIPGRHFAERMFDRIREEVGGRGADRTDPGAFAQLGEVGLAIRELQGEERGGEALRRYGAFLFQAYGFREAGEPLFLLSKELARELVREGPPGYGGAPGEAPRPEGAHRSQAEHPSWSGALPADAGYLQLPRHLFWSHAEEGAADEGAGNEGPGGESAPAEPLDGFFWTRSAGDTLSLLAAMGMRADRPGLSVVDLPPVPMTEVRASVDRAARGDDGSSGAGASRSDFETTLPGGELSGLHSIQTVGEALKLVARVFAYIERRPESVGPAERSPRPGDAPLDPGAPSPSLLPFRRIGP